MVSLLNVDVYPKELVLRDATKVVLRPLRAEDKVRLLRFFERVPEEDRYYLKENVTAPEVVLQWTSHIDTERVIPIVATVGDDIVADATLHRSRAAARRHMAELRIVVDPDYREKGLGRRLIRELVDIAVDLGLHKVSFELVAHREEAAIRAARSMGFRDVAGLVGWVKDPWGNHQDLVVLELPLQERELWWRY